ncbi:right-handed parallel beta-helix repeat-containing protein [uncultured Gimesia sp.]|uniref:right-handed parallel beta-helix repeat-containing protein n=1 Tax=uncultured Gimesia sp. TaxID=1678688 RepID=UPI0030D96F1B|tara:strand:+ start:405794 stop:407209 length:1416 start_codon:yes stop_codon:yes gene_type:complete
MRGIVISFSTLLVIGFLVISSQPGNSQNNNSPAPASATPSVKSFGATGDGKTDDTAAIQRAVDSRQGSITFPKGIYRVTKTISVDLEKLGPTSISSDGTATIIMAGAGPAFRFIGTHEGTASPHTVKENVWLNQRSPLIDGLEIVGDHPEACGVEATGTMQITLTRLTIRRALHGIHFVKRNRNLIVSNCHIYQNRGAGIFYDHVNIHQSNIVGCHISYNAGGGVVVRKGDIRNIHIGTCDIEGNMGDENSEPTANVLIDSEGASVGEIAIVGCTIQHDHNAPGSANIRINEHARIRPHSDEYRDGNITIADNVLSDVQTNIEVTSARGVTITGNTMWKGYTHNIRIDDCRNILVSNNVLDRNPRYHYGDGSTAKVGALFTNCDGCTISGNHISGTGDETAALEIRDSRRMNLTNCTILDYAKEGLLLKNVSYSRVSDCLIQSDLPNSENAHSIKVIGGKDNQIVDNMFEK